jgi:hypothetical protein
MGIASAPQWPRETLWRQGAFLRKEDACGPQKFSHANAGARKYS